MYLTTSLLDMTLALSLISIFMETPKDSHWQAEKIILSYVNGTNVFGILYIVDNDFRLIGYIGSDRARSLDVRKSTSGYMFHHFLLSLEPCIHLPIKGIK